MSEGFSSGDYLPEIDGVEMASFEATAYEAAQAPQTLGLSEEDLADLVARSGPVPEIDEYVRRPTPALLVVLTGPSGVGKDVTLERMQDLKVPFHYAVTVTTRRQRPGEIHGTHYFFLSDEEYDRMLVQGQLLENAEIYGNRYGIPRNQVVGPLKRGKDVIIKADVQGARTLREKEPEAVVAEKRVVAAAVTDQTEITLKKKYLIFPLLAASFGSPGQKADSIYVKKKLVKTDVQILLSYYTQNGSHSAVTGGNGTEKLHLAMNRP